MLGGAGSAGGDELLTVTVVRDEHGYGMKVSGDNPVYVQSVKEHGAAWRAGLRSGDRILRVDNVSVEHHSHQQVVHMIRATPTTVLTVQQNTSRLKTPITAPVPANLEKQRQFEASKVKTIRLMLEQEQKYIRELRNELVKVPDVRKQTELESAEQRCATLQHQIDAIMAGQLVELARQMPSTPGNTRTKTVIEKPTTPIANTGFLSGLPRSLSNLTGQSLRNLRQVRQKNQQENQPPLVRQNSDESNNKRRHVHNNTVPMVPTTCLDNVSPPPLPPRSIERPKRNPLSPTSPPSQPISPLSFNSQIPTPSKYYHKRLPDKPGVMHQSMPMSNEDRQIRRSSHSLDGELDGPAPNSIALQMNYPLVNAPPPPLLTDNRTGVPVLHVRSRSSPEQLDHDLSKSATVLSSPLASNMPSTMSSSAAPLAPAEWGARHTPPPGTPPPPYHTNTQPCADPQRAIISMEEDDSPPSENSTYSGLFSNLRSVRESKVRTAVLLNWLIGERRCACACLLLVLTDEYRAATGVSTPTLRRWAYEIHSAFLMPHAVLQLNGVDENMANEIEHVLVNEYDKEELLRNVFRKARQKAKEELGQQLAEFQVKRQVGLATLYGPGDDVIHKCHLDKVQEQVVVERLMSELLRGLSGAGARSAACGARDSAPTLLAALQAAASALHARPAIIASAVGGQRGSFLQRDKLYKQRVKQITKQHPQPFVVRGHHLQLQALTSVGCCHRCENVIWGLAPQAYVCTDCKLRVHRGCARAIEEGCCLDGEHQSNRISRFMERIHYNNQLQAQDSTEKKNRKASGSAHFLNMERSFRKTEDDAWDQTLKPDNTIERRDASDESLYESADGQSDVISASDDALPRLGKTPTISKESLKLAITDEEAENKFKKTHRKAISLSNPLEMVKSFGDEWFEPRKKDLDKNSEKKKSRESLWSEEDRDSIHGSTTILDQIRKNSKKEDKSQSNSRKSSNIDAPKRKSSKGSSVSSFNFLRRKKTPTSCKPVEVVPEDVGKILTIEEILNFTKLFLEGEQRHSSIEIEEKEKEATQVKPPVETDTEDEAPTPKVITEHRRRLSRQTSRSKSKARGKSQSLKINTLRKSHSGTLKKGKKKGPPLSRSRQTSIVEQTPIVKKKNTDVSKHNSWLFTSKERRDASDESLYESADGQSDVISASDDALPRLGKTPTISKESLKLAITDEEAENKFKKTHRKAISLSNPLEMVKSFGDEWFEPRKKDLDKNSEKKKSRESLWSEEDRDSIHGSTTILDQIRKNSKKEDKSQSNSRKSSNIDAPKRKSSKGSSVSSFNFLRRKKTPTSCKPVEVVPEDVGKILTIEEILNFTKLFLEGEQRHSSIEIEEKEKEATQVKPPVETDTEDEAPTPKVITEHRRRLSRQTSRSKSKARGKSQSLKINTLRKSHSGTLKKGKKKGPPLSRSRQTSIVEQTPIVKKKNTDVSKHNSWLFTSKGESKREGSNEEPTAPDADVDTSDATNKEPDKDNTWRVPSGGRGVNRAESCRDREREAPRRGKHRNASDPNRLTAHHNHDLEGGAPTAPSGSSSSSSLSSRSNESNTVAAEQHASQSDWSEEDEPLATQWAESIHPHVLEGLSLSPRLRKRQEFIHELIVSEGSHVRWLKVLGKVFLRPLEGQPTLLSPEELRQLFPNLPSVREKHSRLYAELRALRTDADAPLVHIRGVADAMLNTLGDSSYGPCLAKFCRGQRMALEALRERRRKNKELHSFLSAREQLPLCGRLQLRDLLACVWQRLTKYQLLLEGVVKTIHESDCESEEDVARLTRALTIAKDVLLSVDTAIRTAENEHRLRAIQSKLEVRAPSGGEWEELRRLDLTQYALRCEGELAIKNDNNKKIHVLAIMLEECLVLIHREGDKFVLKPISQSSQQHLSPLIKWDKVLFRPNAAVRNTFFLMNINGVQMHELSANTAAEYTTWVKHIQDAPLAKLTELKPATNTPSHHATRSHDDSGINVSRNPSDASEKSEKSHFTADEESERDRISAERSSVERERDSNTEEDKERSVEKESVEKEQQVREEKEEVEKEERHKPRRPTEGRIVTHSLQAAPALEPSAALQVAPPAALHAATAVTAYTHHERLRRLDDIIARCLRAKASIVAELLHVPEAHHLQMADLAVAEALGQVDVSRELRAARGVSRSNSTEEDSAPDMQQLLLAACTQANQLTALVRQHLCVDEASAVAARARCDACARGRGKHAEPVAFDPSVSDEDPLAGLEEPRLDDTTGSELSHCDPIDPDDVIESSASAALLARELVSPSAGLQHTLSRLLAGAGGGGAGGALRAELAALRDCNDSLRARRHEYQAPEEFFPKADPIIQDHPSNGG